MKKNNLLIARITGTILFFVLMRWSDLFLGNYALSMIFTTIWAGLAISLIFPLIVRAHPCLATENPYNEHPDSF